ncbi:MAG: hypothetical protein JRI68_04010 [Deltaproteobacteria bacterium]|nr:hypothetical protein [Deltaproteobacteria bacterium]
MAPSAEKHRQGKFNKQDSEPAAEETSEPTEQAELAKALTGACAAAGVLCALLLVRQPSWTLSLLDAGFWTAAVGLTIARHAAVKQQVSATGWGGARRGAITLAIAVTAWATVQMFGGEPGSNT